MTDLTLQLSMTSFKGETGHLMLENPGFEGLPRHNIEIPALMVRVALNAFAAQPGMVTLFRLDPFPDFPVTVQTFPIRHSGPDGMTFRAIPIIVGVPGNELAGTDEDGKGLGRRPGGETPACQNQKDTSDRAKKH